MPVSVRQRPQFRFPVQGAFPEPDRALPDPQPGLRGQDDHFRREFHAPGPERQLFRRLPDQMASGGIGGLGPKYFSISLLLRLKAFFVKSHSRVGRFRITFRRRSTRFCQYL